MIESHYARFAETLSVQSRGILEDRRRAERFIEDVDDVVAIVGEFARAGLVDAETAARVESDLRAVVKGFFAARLH